MSELELIAAVLRRYCYNKPFAWRKREFGLMVILDGVLYRPLGGMWQLILYTNGIKPIETVKP